MSSSTLSPILAECKTREQAAEYLGLQSCTLAGWAHTGKFRDELPFAMIGKKSFYRVSDLEKFLASRFSPAAVR